MIKAVIYDLDDTMVNTSPLHIQSWYILLKEYDRNYDEVSKEMRSEFMAMRIREVAQRVIDFFQLDTDLETFYQKRIHIFIHLIQKNIEMLPGLVQSLKLFKKNSLKIGIGSSGTKDYIEIILKKCNLLEYFDVIVTADDVKKGKPDPEVYSITAQKLGVKSQECVVLEDADKGIQAAKKAGCFCIAVKNPNVYGQKFSQADLVIDSLFDITMEILKSLV